MQAYPDVGPTMCEWCAEAYSTWMRFYTHATQIALENRTAENMESDWSPERMYRYDRLRREKIGFESESTFRELLEEYARARPWLYVEQGGLSAKNGVGGREFEGQAARYHEF